MRNHCRFPKIFFSTSKKMHYAGTYDGHNIMIATDFPLWFVVNVVTHEFGHYVFGLLPITFNLKYQYETKMEYFAEFMIRLLPEKHRTKIRP